MKTICLPEPGLQFRGKMAVAVGFGATSRADESNIKKYVQMDVTDRTFYNEKLFGTFLRPDGATHVPDDPQGTCQGDSGG